MRRPAPHPCVREGVIVGTGRGYQTLINQALRDYLTNCELEDTLRRVVREELRETGGRARKNAGWRGCRVLRLAGRAVNAVIAMTRRG